MSEGEVCSTCGGDGRIGNAFGGSSTTCPGCHGTGRRSIDGPIFHDVTKTKPSHHKQATAPHEKQKWPVTAQGATLAAAVRDCATCPADTKTRLIIEIMEHEATHGRCTETFVKKIRKQIRPPG